MVNNVVVEPVTLANMAMAVDFVAEAVTGNGSDAREHFADHADGAGTSLLAIREGVPIGVATLRWESDYAGFSEHDVPLIHQVAVDEDVRRQGVATALMDSLEDLVRARGRVVVGTTVGLADTYGPAQRLYARRGYLPDGRGACLGQEPVSLGTAITVDHDLILWLTKDLAVG